MSLAQEVLINVTPQETRVAILEQGIVQELHIERASSLGIVGNIYRGTVVRVLPGMQSAFVEIGLQRAAFLHAADIMECHAEEGDIKDLSSYEYAKSLYGDQIDQLYGNTICSSLESSLNTFLSFWY